MSADESSTITNRFSNPPTITFDSVTGILTVQSVVASDSSMLKPGLVAGFLAVALCAFGSQSKQHSAILLVLSLGLGVASAGMVVADITIRVPGCFHTEGANSNTLVFDSQCNQPQAVTFKAPAAPVAAIEARSIPWVPITPNKSFLPANDHGQHYLTPAEQYEVWKQNYGRADSPEERQNFYAFTESCRIQNMNPNREWTAACNQFAGLSHADWKAQILANNAAKIAAAEAQNGRRLLATDYLFHEISADHKRQLLQSNSFSWIGSGKLTAVKNQGNCGSCYAHSTTSQMEAHLAILKGTQPVELSREQLKDCSQNNPGCDGGVPQYMYQYAAASAGLGTEAAYPYVPSNRGCSSQPASSYKNDGYNAISPNELAFKAAVQNAPVAVTVCAGTWNNYAGGMFTNCGNSQSCNVDHAVLLVGYGSDNFGDYWLIQNSWATSWGEGGFIRLPRTDSSSSNTGACGLTRYAGYQAKNPTGTGSSGGGGTTPTATDCQGYWNSWSQCSVTCGGGSQSRSFTVTQAAANGGAACPAPQSQSCNTALCDNGDGGGGGGGGDATTCLNIANSVLGPYGDGDYRKAADWDEGWCGSSTLPQYTMTRNGQTLSLFFFATNCWNNVKVAGMWGLGPAGNRGAYQWSDPLTIVNGVVPPPMAASGEEWTIAFSAGVTC